MKTINKSPLTEASGISPWISRIRNTLEHGFSWYGNQQSMEIVIQHLGRVLNNRFSLVKSLTLPGLTIEIPAILIGPSGIHTIYASPLKGVYRVKGTSFGRMDSTTRQIKSVNPNLVKRALMFGKAVQFYLQKKGVEIPEIESILVFTDPGIHVDASRPAVRVIQIDALERFGMRLMQGRKFLSSEQVNLITRILLNPNAAPDQEIAKAEPEEDEFANGFGSTEGPSVLPVSNSEQENPPEEDRLENLLSADTLSTDSPIPAETVEETSWEVNLPMLGTVRMLRKQWLILGIMAGMEGVILIIFLFIILKTA